MDGWIAVARVLRARGNKGEVSAAPLSSRLERFQHLREAMVLGPQGPLFGGVPAELESVWEHAGRIILKFRGIDTISDAERLAGAEICVPASERPPLPEGEYYQSDLIGFEVVDSASGRTIGRVTGWQEYGGPPLLEVRDESTGAEVLVPFARSICVGIETEQRRIVAVLPEGLVDLGRPGRPSR